MNTKHTPGPWHKGKHCTVYDQLGRRIANSFEGVMVIQISDAECEANACLIAAAPELLEALKELVARCDGAEGVRADGSNIQTHNAHGILSKLGEA